MKYCVIKDMTTVIDGSENPEEIMLQNAKSAGYTKEQVEILTEEEYRVRIDSLPKLVPQPTIEERVANLENLQLQQGGLI